MFGSAIVEVGATDGVYERFPCGAWAAGGWAVRRRRFESEWSEVGRVVPEASVGGLLGVTEQMDVGAAATKV
jgi:hypothetical protein